jgi:Ca2+-binding EF-hand superfamily protein
MQSCIVRVINRGRQDMALSQWRTAGFAAAFMCALAVVDHAAAQWRVAQPREEQRQSMRFAHMDDNGDGVITRSEWQGTRQAFNAADVNRDGVLSGTEVWDDQNLGPTGTSGSVSDRRGQFTELDANDDGVVSRNEWRGARRTFSQHDVNGDGVITRREYVGDEVNGVSRRQNRVVIDVNAQTRWTETGLHVNVGDVIVFNASGTVRLSANESDVASTAGATSGRRAPSAPLPDALAGALIGRIGDSAPFGIGNQRQITAPGSGQLYLGVNDDHLEDNSGGFHVRLSVR